RSVRLVHAGDAEKHTPRIADGRREAQPLHAQIRVTGNGHGRTWRGNGDFAERFCFHRNQSQARILYFALVVTVTFTLVESCVPSVTVKTLALPLLSAQEISTPAGTAPRPCATLCCAPLPVCTADKNCFCFDGYAPLKLGCGPLLWNSGALTGVFLTSTITF